MANTDGMLRGANPLGVLGTSPQNRGNLVGQLDRDDLYRFSLREHSRFDLTLSKIAKGANIDVELYALKCPWTRVVRQIGKLEFRQIRNAARKANLQLIRAARRGGHRNESLAIDSLNSGEYVLRVLQRSGNTRYRLRLAAKAIDTPPPSGDTVAPNATLSATNLSTAGSNTYDFTVTYRDNEAINIASIDNSDIQVTGANGFSQLATRVAVSDSRNGTPRTVTYRITAPDGTWDSADNGTYNIALQGNQISDTSGNVAAAGLLGNFQVNIDRPPPPPPGDTVAPTATLSATDLLTRGSSIYDFTVTYSDNGAVNVASFDSNDILVTGNGFSQLATFVGVNADGNGTPRSVTYRITKPNGNWDSADNGVYTIALQANQVSDISGNLVTAGLLGNFQVSIDQPPPPPPPDIVAPTATLTATNLSIEGNNPYEFTVTYSDNTAINVSSLDNNDLQVTNLNGFSQSAAFVRVNGGSNGTPRTATYRITAPGGTWDHADNGVYSITLQANQVSDTNGNFVTPGLLGNFQVNIAQPPPPPDIVAPIATLNTTNISTGGNDFTVTYSDNIAIDTASLDNSDIRVTGPNNFSQLATRAHVNNNNNGTPRTATYRITAPGGTWDYAGNGVYMIALQANQVNDLSGNAVLASILGSFQVDIAAPRRKLRFSGTSSSNVSNVSMDIATVIPGTSIPNVNESFKFDGAVKNLRVELLDPDDPPTANFDSANLVSSRFDPSTDTPSENRVFFQQNLTGREVKYVISVPNESIKITIYLRPAATETSTSLSSLEALKRAIELGDETNFVVFVSGDTISVNGNPMEIGNASFGTVILEPEVTE
ncbi:MAG: hypothetical protein HC865_07755 [Cyanobacteria bacterium RU_5_0]|nr:hypothetical protein [Cyanobacteria bacterium RU_5_0]